MEVDTAPTKSSVNLDKLCNGSTNGDVEAEKSPDKVKNGTKVNGLHDEEPMEVEESNGVREESKEDDTESKNLENGDSNGDSKMTDDPNDSSKEAEESKEIEDTDTADDSAQVLDSSSVQNISESSVQSESMDSSSKDNEGDKEVKEKDNKKSDEKKDEEEGEKSEDKKEDTESGDKETDTEKKDDGDETIEDKDKEKENSGKEKEKGDKNQKDKGEGPEKRDNGKTKDSKDDSSDRDKDKDKTAGPVDLTDDKADKGESSQSASKSRIHAVLKTPSPSTQMRPMAGLLFDLGMDLARQQVYKDLIRIQQKKQSMDKLDDKESRQLDKLKEAYDDLVAKNSPYTTNKNPECEKCEFKADLDTVNENHKEYGHVNEAGVIKCSFCGDHFKVSQQFIVHMEQKHKRKGRVIVRHSFFVCPFCPFEHNSKASFNKHILRCERVFNLLRNLEPTPADCDIPIKLPKPPVVQQAKPKPTTVAQATAAAQRNKAALNRPPLNKGQQNAQRATVMQAPIRMTHQQAASATIRPQLVAGVPPGAQVVQVGNQWYHMVSLNGQRFLTPVPPGTQVPNNTPATTGVVQSPRQQSPAASKSPATSKSPASSKTSSKSQLLSKNNKDKGTFEICEICGGFVKDRDSLRIHFFWAHKVDIQKDVFNGKNPNLNCDRCNFRCWTVAGMQRHKSMAHKDASRLKDRARQPFYCTLCRPVPELLHTETFWLHMAAKHRIGPDSVFTQPQCVVCGVPNVGVPRALETHMLNVHNHLFSVDLLQLARKLLAPNTGLNPNASQQPAISSSKSPKKTIQVIPCDHCDSVFNTMNDLELHNNYEHSFKCSRCKTRLSSREMLTKHFHDKHKDDKDPCTLCGAVIAIGRPMVRHMRSNHLKDCSVVIRRLPQKEVDKRMERYIQMFGRAGSAYRTPQKGRKRGRSSVASEPVIVVEETPVKKSRTSATRKAVSEERRRAMKIKDVIEVDGEEILVEMQQSEDEDDSVTVVTVESSEDAKNDSPNKKDEKKEETSEPQTIEDEADKEKTVESEKSEDKGDKSEEAMDTSESKDNQNEDKDEEEPKKD